MRKSIRLLAFAVALFAMLGIQSCDSVDKGDVLDCVPYDASVVVYGDLSYVAGQAGVEKGKIGEPLKSILEKYSSRGDLEEMENAAEVSEYFLGDAAFFMNGSKVWFVAAMRDADKFLEYLKKEQDFDLDEEDGVKKAEKNKMCIMVKDNMLFIGGNPDSNKSSDDPEDVKELLDLGDESFASNGKTSKIAEEIREKEYTFYALANLNKLANIADSRDFDQMKAGLSMVYSDPTFISGNMKIGEDGATAEIKVLDSKYEPAKCSLPAGSIDAGALKYAAVPGNTFAAAMDLPSSLVDQICNAASQFLMPEMTALIKCLNGTIAFTSNPAASSKADMMAIMATTNNNADAIKLGDFLQNQMGNMKAQYSGKYLRIVMPGGPAANGDTRYASILGGKPLGCVADLGAMMKNFGLSGDYAELGTLAIYADTADKSLSIKAEWKCKNIVKKTLDLIGNADTIERTLEGFFSKYDTYSYDEPVDTTFGGYDPDYGYTYYDSVAPAVEPDYLY